MTRVGEFDRLRRAAERLEASDGRANARRDVRIEPLGVVFFGHADADAAHAPAAGRFVRPDRRVDAGGVVLVAACDDLEDARGSSHVVREGTDLIEARGKRDEPVA